MTDQQLIDKLQNHKMETEKESIEITVERVEKETHQVKLPFFRKHRQYAYKVISKDNCLQVNHLADSPEITLSFSSMAWLFKETEDCTEGEFSALYNATLERLQKLAVA